MSVSIMDMQTAATSFPDISVSNDIGNVIEVSEMPGDDLGMNLLANSKFGGGGGGGGISLNTGGGSSGSSMNVGASAPAFADIDVKEMETLPSINLDLGSAGNSVPIGVTKESPFQPSNTFGADGSYANHQSSTVGGINLSAPQVPRDLVREADEKAELLNKLQRLEAKGFPVSKRFTMENELSEIKMEYNRLVDARQLETSIRFQRNMLMGLVTGMEWMNNKFDPFDLKLDGWSEAVHENVEDYDEIFEELYDKYKERGKMPPEARLLFQLAGSGFMCHVSNTFFRAKMPSAEDVFKKNPELAKQFAAAAATQAGGGFGNFMGMAMGVPQGGPPQEPTPPERDRATPMGVPMGMASGPAPTGVFFNAPQMPQNFASQPPPQVARREMRGPSGVDDILRTFEEVRLAEESAQQNGPPTPTAQGSAFQVAEELQSVGSGEMSVATERTGPGRKKKRATPVGNVVSLNV